MPIILVSDVFGVTPALIAMSNKLGANAIVDPYKGQVMGFQSEADAYAYFVKNVGFDNYLARLAKVIEPIEQQTTLIGFSVGASAIWRLSESEHNSVIKQAFCFYGSQIRNFTQVEPCFKINLVFPISEPHFDVVALQDCLANKINVNTKQVKYLHGFMNYHSANYNKLGYEEQIELLCDTAN